jgi:hypothetical protein
MSDLTLRDRLLAADALQREADRLEAADDDEISVGDLFDAATERRLLALKTVRGYHDFVGQAFNLVMHNGDFPAVGAKPSPAAFGGNAGWLLLDHENGTYSIERDDNDPVDHVRDQWAAFVSVLTRAQNGDPACIEALCFHVRDMVAVAAAI